MSSQYDFVVIGSGAAASAVASRARDAGRRVATVGTARFRGPHALSAEGLELEARNIVLATGAEPVPLGIPGQEYAISHEEFLALEELPERVVFIGGGHIAAEFSNIAALAGARVTVLQRGERMLAGFDPDLVGWLMESFCAMGITVETGVKVEAIERNADGLTVRYSAGSAATSIAADLVVHAAGRRPALQALELDAGGVAVDGRGRLQLNEWLQSVSNPAVYAAGRCAQRGPAQQLPAAGRDAEIVAANLLHGNTRTADYEAVPAVAFTIPPIAAVGLSEAAARAAGRSVRVHCGRAADWHTARRPAEPAYGFKVLIDEAGGRILGAHLVGPGAEDTINLFALAMREDLTTDALREALSSNPTVPAHIAYML